ncbi:MAG: hypothetical protein GZ088_09690 [Acidipila sp.]|nr:hypothetical protein [Acidipila sp.]
MGVMGQAAPVIAAAGNFPANYPYAYSQPLPSALLRPLQQPLYDTEVIPAAGTPIELVFFQRQLGQTTAFGGITKTEAETNIQQPGQLANPLEFSLFGFLFEVAPAMSLADFQQVYTASAFIFTYTGNRVYLSIPTTRIPQGVSAEGFAATTVAATTLAVVHNGVGHISNFYKFTIGRSALRIRPTESFQARIRWPNGAPTIAGTAFTTRLRVYITGLQWTPL